MRLYIYSIYILLFSQLNLREKWDIFKNISLNKNFYQNLVNFFYILLYSGNVDLSFKLKNRILLNTNKKEDCDSLFGSMLLASDKIMSAEKYYKFASRYGKVFNSEKIVKKKNLVNKHSKIKVGYICHFFFSCHSIMTLCQWLLNHDNQMFEIYAISDDAKSASKSFDEKFEIKFKKNVNFIDSSKWNQNEFVEKISNLNFDILFELNGHCAFSRYKELNHRLAPIQISWYNIAGTSGIKEIDYIVVDKNFDLKKQFYTEKIIELNHPVAIKIPEYLPTHAEIPPSIKKKYITFGYFGALHKINIDHFNVWCKIIKKVKNSKFYLKSNQFHDERIKNFWRFNFKKFGIGENQFVLENGENHKEMLKKYDNMDIMLDTYPHNSGMSSQDSLLMGVPVVTICGERQSSQISKAIFPYIGCEEFITYNYNDYIKKSISLARDRNMLLKYKKNLRDKMKNSKRSDIVQFVKELENSLLNLCKNTN